MEPDNPPEGTHLERGREFGRGDAVFSDLPHGSTLEAVRIGLWEADPISREAWCSPAHGAIFGYSPDQVGDWSIEAFWNHVHPEDRGRVDQSIQEGIRNGTGCEFECRILRKDKALRWVAIRSAPVPGGTASGRRVRGIAMDITERKLAEMAAQEGDRRFALLANSAPVLIWTAGLDKLCDFFNEPWLAFTGRSMQQELGNGWAEGVHPEDLDRCLRTYETHFEARLPFRMEYRLRRHDGVYRWILDHGVPRYLPEGTFTGYIGSCVDVTEQRSDREKAQEAARSARALQSALEDLTTQQRTILDTTPLGIGLIRDRRVVWTNPAHQALLGYDAEELHGMPARALYANPADEARLEIEGRDALRRGATYTTEARLKRKGAAPFWCQMIVRAIAPTDPEGGSIWLLRDVEESRRAEAEFRLQSEMLSHMNEGVVLVSASNRTILHTNPTFDRMLGYDAGELWGRPVSVVNAPGECSPEETARRILAELQARGRWEGEIANRRKDGTSILCHASVSRFEHSEFGDVWLSVHTDITRTKEMERALREAKQRYDELIRGIPTGVQLVRLHTDGTYSFDFVSPRTAELVGVDEKDLYRDATLWMRNAWPEDAAEAEKENRRCIASQEPYEWEGRFQVDGTTRWLRFEGWPIAQAGGDVLWNAVVNDITEHKALEAAQREAQKLTAIGHLAGGMAHEFNNILAAMLMNIGLAQQDTPPGGVLETLGELEKSCVRAGDLIKQLLAVSQRSVLHPQRIEWNEFLARQVPLLQRFVGQRIRIECTGSRHPLPATIDVSLVEQALRNLCENAAEAMQGSGLIRIGLETVGTGAAGSRPRSEERRERFACLSVSDQGCGMDPATRGRLFEPFFTTKDVGRGTGLGLATVLGIVRQHRGWVEVQSAPGRGSCFRLYLPLEETTDPPSAEGPPQACSPSSAGTILLAEDDTGLRKAVSLLLGRAGYRVLAARDAAEARSLWETHRGEIDLLFSDVAMPGAESGLQLAGRLMEERPELKVILTSGHETMMEDQPAGVRNRIVYLAKPVASEVLLRTLEQTLHPVR